MIIRTRFGSIGPSAGVSFVKPSRTKQSFAAETNINAIMARAAKTGVMPFADRFGKGVYADVSDVPDLAMAMRQFDAAQADFASLPATLRKRFNNDAMELLAFVADSSNRDEAISLGLIDKPVVEPVVKPVVEPVVEPVKAL